MEPVQNENRFLKEILLKIGFIKEMGTTGGNKEVPQIFLPDSPYMQKYNLIHLTSYQFVTAQQAWVYKIYCWLRNSMFDKEGNRIPRC